jgi:hypothetical protein
MEVMMNGDFRVRRAIKEDAQAIARIFDTIYENYYHEEYTIPSKIQNSVISDSHKKVFVIELCSNQTVAGEYIEEPLVVGNGSVVFSDEYHIATLSNAAILPKFQGLECNDKSAYDELLTTRYEYTNEKGAAIIQTEANSSAHAITQHKFDKLGFIPMGILRGRYPAAFKNYGRETVILMIDSNSHFQQRDSIDEKMKAVYVPETGENLIKNIINNINSHMTDGELEREILNDEQIKTHSTDESGFALEEVKNDGEIIEYDVLFSSDEGLGLNKITKNIKQNVLDKDVEYISININANEPAAATLTKHLLNQNFSLAKFVPAAFRGKSGEWNDVIGVQYSDCPPTESQLLENILPLVDELGINYEIINRDDPIDGVVRLRI